MDSNSLYHGDTATWIAQRQADFEHEVGLDPATYVPPTDDELSDLVYEDYLEVSTKGAVPTPLS